MNKLHCFFLGRFNGYAWLHKPIIGTVEEGAKIVNYWQHARKLTRVPIDTCCLKVSLKSFICHSFKKKRKSVRFINCLTVEDRKSKYFTVIFQYPSVLNHVIDFTASETDFYWPRIWIFSDIFLIKVENSKRRMAYSIIPPKNSTLFVFIYLSCKKSRLNHDKKWVTCLSQQ